MDCQTAEELVVKYIDHKLSVSELEDFLLHIEYCSSCYDELETYFIVHEALQQLNEEDETSVLDFRKLLQQDIHKSQKYILKMKFQGVIAVMGLCVLIAGIGVLLFYILTQFL